MSTNNQSDWKEREVGALWKKVSGGNKANYCTGYIVSDELGSKVKQRVIMFANKSKSSEKSPDFIIYTSINENTYFFLKKELSLYLSRRSLCIFQEKYNLFFISFFYEKKEIKTAI